MYFFLISLETYSLTYGLFRIVLFSNQLFGDFPINFLLLNSILIPLWPENMLFDINSLKFIEISFVAQVLAYLGICFMSN